MSSSHKTTQYNLRLTDNLKSILKEEAEKNQRTLNAEIVARLEQSFFKTGVSLTKEEVDRIANRVKEVIVNNEKPTA